MYTTKDALIHYVTQRFGGNFVTRLLHDRDGKLSYNYLLYRPTLIFCILWTRLIVTKADMRGISSARREISWQRWRRPDLGSFRLYELSIFWVFLHFFNVFFSVESENDIGFLEKPIGKKLFNFKVIYSLCNTEEMLTLIFPLFQGKNHVI